MDGHHASSAPPVHSVPLSGALLLCRGLVLGAMRVELTSACTHLHLRISLRAFASVHMHTGEFGGSSSPRDGLPRSRRKGEHGHRLSCCAVRQVRVQRSSFPSSERADFDGSVAVSSAAHWADRIGNAWASCLIAAVLSKTQAPDGDRAIGAAEVLDPQRFRTAGGEGVSQSVDCTRRDARRTLLECAPPGSLSHHL